MKDANVRAIFDKDQSWVKDTSDFDFQTELKLQQIRFDLYEVYARKFNREIDKIRNQKEMDFSDLERIGDMVYSELNNMESEIFNDSRSISERVKTWRPRIDSLLQRSQKWPSHDEN